MATKNFKKRYFLFGEVVCRALDEEGIKKAVKVAETEGFGLYYWDELSTPDELLNEFEGWSAWTEITKSQYMKFLDVNK